MIAMIKSALGLKSERRLEIVLIAALSLLFLLSFSNVLLTKTATLSHDSIYWCGIFHYFSESIYNGFWPSWNPYTHGGEPFYYNYVQKQLLNPIIFINVLLGKLCSIDILTLYHWSFFIQLLFMNLGIYLFLGRFYKHLFTKVILFTIILFSSLSLTCLRLIGILDVFHLVPWILLVLFRIIEKESKFNWVLLAAFLGVAFHTYSVVYTLSFLFIFLGTFFIKNREDLKKIFSVFKRENIGKALLFFSIIIILASPMWTTFLFDMGKLSPVARTLDGTTKGLFLSFEEISKAETYWRGATNPRDFLGLVNPFFPHAFLRGWYRDYINIDLLTETFLYIGILPLVLAIYGIVFARHKYKLNFLFFLFIIASMMLGTKFIFFRIFAFLFPPIRLARHPMQFFPFFLFTLYYFSGLGIERVIDKYEELKEKLKNENTKMLFISKGLLLGILSVVSLYFLFKPKLAELVGIDFGYLIYFYLLCAFFLLLFKRSFVAARYGKRILVLFVITDLFVFNYFNRPLMLSEEKPPFPGKAQKAALPEKRIFDIPINSPIDYSYRFKSLLFRIQAIEKNYDTMQTSLFELKNFHTLMPIPDSNLRMIAGVSEPIIKYYSKARPYIDEDFDRYFKGLTRRRILKNHLFLNDTEKDEDILLYSNRKNDVLDEDSFDYEVIKYQPADIHININAKNKGFLYFSDGYDDYWKAYIDSKETKLYRANINFKAIAIPEGRHVVRFIYKPVYHLISLWAYFLTLGVIFVYIIRYLINRNSSNNQQLGYMAK